MKWSPKVFVKASRSTSLLHLPPAALTVAVCSQFFLCAASDCKLSCTSYCFNVCVCNSDIVGRTITCKRNQLTRHAAAFVLLDAKSKNVQDSHFPWRLSDITTFMLISGFINTRSRTITRCIQFLAAIIISITQICTWRGLYHLVELLVCFQSVSSSNWNIIFKCRQHCTRTTKLRPDWRRQKTLRYAVIAFRHPDWWHHIVRVLFCWYVIMKPGRTVQIVESMTCEITEEKSVNTSWENRSENSQSSFSLVHLNIQTICKLEFVSAYGCGRSWKNILSWLSDWSIKNRRTITAENRLVPACQMSELWSLS